MADYRGIMRVCMLSAAAILTLLPGCAAQKQQAKVYQWDVHDMNRPRPAVVAPGREAHLPPSDAIVLFDGTDLNRWVSDKDGSVPKWLAQDGYMQPTKNAGDIRTKENFGSCQLHIEWASPEQSAGSSQGRGNSGVFLMGKYEVQVLDSYNNDTYPDGQAASIYGQKPPMVNACRAPGQWQSYDIIFHRPVFKDGRVIKPGTVTVLHNGVLVQDNWEIEGSTWHKKRSAYEVHEDKLPIKLQDHGNIVRYRNIWIRPLKDNDI